MMTNIEEDRRAKLDKVRALGLDPYGNPGLNFTSIPALKAYHRTGTFTGVAKENAPNFSVTGRVMLRRGMGKLSFLTIQGEGETIQVALDASLLSDQRKELTKLIDLGDIIAADGKFFPTKTGEATIWAGTFFIIAKSLVPPPDKVHGLEDPDLRFRKRHIDLLDPGVRNIIMARSKMIAAIRNRMLTANYMEVETPILMPSAGGAAAKPFCTHHNALDTDMVLRIAPELYLKRLLVGGFEKVFEIGKNFRNEGISTRHNPEFTVLEAYAAHGNYVTMMHEVKLIIQTAAKAVGKTTFKHGGVDINLYDEWKILRLDELIQKEGTIEEKYHIFENEIAPLLVYPTFITHMPKSVVPLAKTSKEYPDCAEMFELYMCGQEIAPGYTEESDPDAQLMAFKAQAKDGHVMDMDFIEVLRYGMPPAGGMGIGIDRLVALLMETGSVRETILFPTLKPKI